MKMKRMFHVFAIISLSVSLAACTSSKTETSPSPSTSVETSATTTPAPTVEPAKKITITYYGGSGLDPIPPTEGPGIDLINAKFNIDYKVQFVPLADFEAKQAVRMAANDVPDLMDVGGGANYQKAAAQGAFLPLDDYIDKYPSFKAVPKYVWDQLRVNGHIYAIPKYFPNKFGKQPIIRQDWLDNLGLKMPTNYEELKAVALAFTNNDPDKNNKKDTYGIELGKGIVYPNIFGEYWGYEWFAKNAAGQYIPGDVSPGAKDRIQFLSDLYKANAIPKDWPTTDEGDVQKAFYAGKFGIWFEQLGKPQHYFDSLLAAAPGAKLSVIPPFVAPDGTQGFRALRGFNGAYALSAKDDPEKTARILEMLNYSRTYVPVKEQTPSNEVFDFMTGKENIGYTMVNGLATWVDKAEAKGLLPLDYLDGAWIPSDTPEEPSNAANPIQKALFDQMAALSHQYQYYVDPTIYISSPKRDKDFGQFYDPINAVQQKMIVGDVPVADWDKQMKAIFYDKGGQDIIDEVNTMLKAANVEGQWIK